MASASELLSGTSLAPKSTVFFVSCWIPAPEPTARKAHPHDRSGARTALGNDCSPLQLDQVAGDREAQPAPRLPTAGTIDLIEALEDPRKIARRDAGPSVADGDIDARIVSQHRYHHLAGSRELQRVVENIL